MLSTVDRLTDDREDGLTAGERFEVDKQQLAVAYGSTPKNMSAGIAGAFLIAAAMALIREPGSFARWIPWLWFIAITALLCRGILIGVEFNSRDFRKLTEEEVRNASRKIVGNAIFCAAVWGSSSWLMLPSGHPQGDFLLLVGISLVLMAGAGSQATHRPLVRAFVLVTTAVFAVGLLRLGDIPNVALALGYCVVAYTVLQYTRDQQAAVRQAITLSVINSKLRRREEEQRQRADDGAQLLIQLKERQRSEAEKANREKSRFLAEAAHDLRQPMQALSSLLDASLHSVRKGQATSAEEHLQAAHTAARIMRSSFGSILELSRLESGGVNPSYSEFSIEDLLSDLVRSMAASALDTRVRVKGRWNPARRMIVRSDWHLLLRLLTNLVSNGIKYADPRKEAPWVLVGAVGLPTRVRIDVVDNGIGIERDDWEQVFQPFIQLQNPARDRDKGLGLGLSIVRSSIALLDEHRLDMRSKVGQGTRFSVEIALVGSEVARQGITPRDDVLEPLSLGAYAIVVEDDPLVRHSTVAILEQRGVLCEVAASYEGLINVLNTLEREPDLLISDYRLPREKTAVDAIAAVRAEFPSLPVLVITAEVGALEEVVTLPSVLILRKPVSAEAMLVSMGKLLRTHEVGS